MKTISGNLLTPLLHGLSLVLLSLTLSSCSDKTSVTPVPATTSDKVIIKGSNTIGEELAPRLVAEYKKDHASAGWRK